MLTLLKKNLKIKANSIQTYFRNIKRIARIVGHDEVPKSSKWLKGEDAKKLKKKLVRQGIPEDANMEHFL